MIIYLIRHGRQNCSDCNLDVPLSAEGRRQAELLGRRIGRYAVDALYSSDLLRALETARIAFAGHGSLLKGHQIRPGLREVDFGTLTGQADPYVKAFYKDYYRKQLALFSGRKEHYVGGFFVPPEEMVYPEGESGVMVMERVMPVVAEWIGSGYQSIAVVTHGGLIRILLCALFGGDFARRLQFGTSLENCSITQLNYDAGKNAFSLERFNDYAHIEEEPSLLRKNFLKPAD
ncbi:MAG: histidine phosphatase family protein [Lachnospiraceae bacterium]|nr:histidine phosphatase family protein [Lachnospiraceae bacterium]